MRGTPTIEKSPPRRASSLTLNQALNSSPMIAVRGLEKRIGAQEILRGVDLSLATGDTLVIIGRSGGGKSVLLKNLIGLMQPDAGEIWIDGQNIIGLSERDLARNSAQGGHPLSRRRSFRFHDGRGKHRVSVARSRGARSARDRTKDRRDARGDRTRRAGEKDAGQPERRDEKAGRSRARDHQSTLLHSLRRTDRRTGSGCFRQHQPT